MYAEDAVLVLLAVLGLGFAAALFPVRKIAKRLISGNL